MKQRRAGSGSVFWRRRRVGACLLLLLAISAGVFGLAQEQPGTAPAYRVDITGAINPGAVGKLKHAIQLAEAAQAPALIMRLDTPGGLLTSTREMVSAIAEARVPVIGYVGPAGASATSAGAFILLASHVAVMNAGTHIGASAPISGDGSDIGGTLGKKVMSDSRAFMRSIAQSRGRNAEVAERFVSEALSLTAQEAYDHHVIDAVVGDMAELPAAVHGRKISFDGHLLTLTLADHEVRIVDARLVDRLLQRIAHPQISHLLISVGMIGLFLELLSPGLVIPGVLGAIALILGFIGVQALPVSLGFLVLVILGIGLMFAEYFVAGFGILGIGGAAAFTLGSLNLFAEDLGPTQTDTILWVSIAVSAALVFTCLLITRGLVGRFRQRSVTGRIGEAMVTFTQDGHVLVDGKRWPARTLEPLRHGDRIVVIEQAPNRRLVVRKAEFK